MFECVVDLALLTPTLMMDSYWTEGTSFFGPHDTVPEKHRMNLPLPIRPPDGADQFVKTPLN